MKSKTKKIPVSELIRLALIYAEQDRLGFADANPGGSPERTEAQELAKAFHEYRIKRFGKTRGEVAFENSKLVPARTIDVFELSRGEDKNE